jgi:type I restriction enzyme, S subunit
MIARIDQLKTGISDSGVNITQHTFRDLKIPLPDLDLQARIIAAAEGQLASLEALDVYLAMVGTRAQRLRSSILAAAFSGRLVSQDADDEPASDLLERIAAERSSFNGQRADANRKARVVREEVMA